MKIYVKEKQEKDVDGKALQVVQIEPSEIKGFTYLVFISK